MQDLRELEKVLGPMAASVLLFVVAGLFVLKKVSRPRFALSGFRKNIEKKYLDKTYQSDMNETLSGNIDQTTKTNNGVTVISNTWGQYTFGQQTAPVAVSNDMLKGLGTGTTARLRIGNKVKVKYLKGAFTFNAAMVDTIVTRTQGGEAFAALTTSSKDGII